MITISEEKLFNLMVDMYMNSSKYPNPHVAMDAATKEIQKVKNCLIAGVVESFYCNQDDGEYNNNPCAEQCNFCKEVEKTLQ